MTTMSFERRTCSVCGAESEQTVIDSTNAFGSMDLDTRPPEMLRDTINTWVQRCPSCGYCASEIQELEQGAQHVVYSDAYKDQLNSSDFPDLANSFLCLSLIHQQAGDYASAGWHSLHAAWVCDDAADELRADPAHLRENMNPASEKCRRRALTLLRRAQEVRQGFVPQAGGEEAMMADLLRRVGEFDEALRACNDGLQKSPDDMIRQVLEFQIRLIDSGDLRRHVVSEAADTGNNT